MTVVFDKNSRDRIARAVTAVESGQRAAQATRAQTQETFTARATTSTPDGNGNYDGVITVLISGVWEDYSAVKIKPANGEALTSGTRYSVRGVALDGSTLVVLVVGIVPSYPALTVRDINGGLTITVPDVTTLEVEESTTSAAADSVYLTLSSPSSGVARVVAHSRSTTYQVPGIIDTTEGQMLCEGSKQIADITGIYRVWLGKDPGFTFPSGYNLGGPAVGVWLGALSPITDYSEGMQLMTDGLALHHKDPLLGSTLLEFSNISSVGCAFFHRRPQVAGVLGSRLYSVASGGTGDEAILYSTGFGVLGPSSTNTGKWGTDSLGNVFEAGICTTVGVTSLPPSPPGGTFTGTLP